MCLKFKIFAALIFSAALLGCREKTGTESYDDGIAPSVPAGLSVFKSRDGEVGIEWERNVEFDFDHYIIYRGINDSTKLKLLSLLRDNYYYDYPLEYDSVYYYSVSAVDNYGRESVSSGFVSASPANFYPPHTPLNFKALGKHTDTGKFFLLSWEPNYDADLLGYEIYRSAQSGFTPDSSNLIGFAKDNSYKDSIGVQLLEKYFFVIRAVDKGLKKSKPSGEFGDVIFDKPRVVFPENNSQVKPFSQFRIQTVSMPAFYKLVVQTNEIFGTVLELNFESSSVNSVISIDFNPYYLEPYKTYYCRVLAYSIANDDPNSFSELIKFSIYP